VRIIALCFLAIATSWGQTPAAQPSTLQSAVPQVQVAPNGAIPITISNANVVDDSGRQLSTIVYSVTNSANSELRELSIQLMFFDSSDNILGGEGYHTKVTLAPGQSTRLLLPLAHYIAMGDRATLVVSGAKSSTQSWRVDPRMTADALLKAAGRSPRFSPLTPLRAEIQTLDTSKVSPLNCCADGSWCDTERQLAQDACVRGLKSFSCNACTCSVSWTCN
jgi:hypothetical protein